MDCKVCPIPTRPHFPGILKTVRTKNTFSISTILRLTQKSHPKRGIPMADKVPVFGKSLYDYMTDENKTKNEQGFEIPGDCTTAFERAFDDAAKGNNTLLTIPAGDYALYKPLCLPSGLFLDVHPHAEIAFEGFETDEKAENIRVRGGVWRLQGDAADVCAFEFSDAHGITLENAKIYCGRGAAVGLCGGN